MLGKNQIKKKKNQTKREFDSGKFVLTPEYRRYTKIKNNEIMYTFNNNTNNNYNHNHNTVDNYNNEYKNKTPIKGRNYIEIGHLNLSNYIKNQSLTSVKNINLTLIPFPPTKPYFSFRFRWNFSSCSKKWEFNIIETWTKRFFTFSSSLWWINNIYNWIKRKCRSNCKFIEKDEKYFSYRLYLQNAIFVNPNYYKDLNKLGRDLKTIIIVDDKPINSKLQQENGIIIKLFIIGKENNNDDYILLI